MTSYVTYGHALSTLLTYLFAYFLTVHYIFKLNVSRLNTLKEKVNNLVMLFLVQKNLTVTSDWNKKFREPYSAYGE